MNDSTTDPEQPEQETLEKSERINLGIDILSALTALAPPGQRFSCEEIAAFCDCSKEHIRSIEQQALIKIRKALKRIKVNDSQETKQTDPFIAEVRKKMRAVNQRLGIDTERN